jgi:predicted cobalt transporter CbtA
VASTAPEPTFQSRLNIRLVAGLTAVVLIVLPKARVSPARTSPTAITPGAFATAFAAATGIGEKLFCAVIA